MKIKFTWLLLLPVALLLSCDGKSKSEQKDLGNNIAKLSNKERQYYSNGDGLYTNYCANCHMDQGQGLGALIPPISKSDYLLNDLLGAARIIKYGLKGPIVVNGKEYNQPMPANPKFTNLEIAEILTFVGNSWGNTHGGVTTEEVAEALKEKVD